MRKHVSNLLGFVAVFCCLTWAHDASATSVLQLDETQLVELSTFIVRGKVISQRAVPGPRGMGIVTLVTIEVSEELVGRQQPRRVVVRHFGGELNGRKIAMPGGPSFQTGNEVVVFVQQSRYLPKGEFLLVGLTQGKFQVMRPELYATFPKGQAPKPFLVRNLHHVKMFNHLGRRVEKLAPKALHLNAVRTRLRSIFSKIQLRRQNQKLKLPQFKHPRPTVRVPHVKTKQVRVPSQVVPKPLVPKK